MGVLEAEVQALSSWLAVSTESTLGEGCSAVGTASVAWRCWAFLDDQLFIFEPQIL
jgi:hypothetical protein